MTVNPVLRKSDCLTDQVFINAQNGISTPPFPHADFCLSLQHILKALLCCLS